MPVKSKSSTSASQTSVSRNSSVSSSTVSSEDFLCISACSSCANIDPPSGTPPTKAKHDLQRDNALSKRKLPSPMDSPYNGDMDLFTWDQWPEKVIDTVNLRRGSPLWSKHTSSSIFHDLADFPVDLAVAVLYSVRQQAGRLINASVLYWVILKYSFASCIPFMDFWVMLRRIVNIGDRSTHTSYCVGVPVSPEQLSNVFGDLLDHIPVWKNTGLGI